MKKKIIVLSMVSLLLLGGCAKGYKEGIYTGTATDYYTYHIHCLKLF